MLPQAMASVVKTSYTIDGLSEGTFWTEHYVLLPTIVNCVKKEAGFVEIPHVPPSPQVLSYSEQGTSSICRINTTNTRMQFSPKIKVLSDLPNFIVVKASIGCVP